MGKLIITKLHNKDIMFAFDDDHRIISINVLDNSRVDCIYMGRVSDINKGLKAAFVSVSPDEKVFVTLSELPKNVKCGDELPVQIKTDKIKTKLCNGSSDICIPGQYVVCHLFKSGINVSQKIDNATSKKLLNAVKDFNIEGIDDYNFVLRTNCAALDESEYGFIKDEIIRFIDLSNEMKVKIESRKLYTCLYSGNDSLIDTVSDISLNDFDKIVTDNRDYYEKLINYEPLKNKDISFYDDEYVSLKNLHSLETYLLRALDKKVYLDCGGYLIIEPTEAMTVIDVNSGKTEGKKKDSESFDLKVNLEAATEIMNQLKIRNISGIIAVDFINMKDEASNQKLMDHLKNEAKKDRIKTIVVDMTSLGIVEITRKKINQSLSEKFKE